MSTLTHAITGRPLTSPFPEGMEQAHFGMGCFWGAEHRFWSLPGVYTTAVGYTGGEMPYPRYRDVCSGLTGHCEVVQVVFEPRAVTYSELLKVFWEGHDPTQGNRQGNDIGSQYRSALFFHDDAQRIEAEASRERYAHALRQVGRGPITTEIRPAGPFWYAEDDHQQHLHKNPGSCVL